MNVMIKPASGQCNMSCDYCFYCDELKQRENALRGFMSGQTLKNIIRKTLLPSTEPVAYAFQGGEPLLRGLEFYQTMLEFQKKYNKSGLPIRNALQTNGTLLDEGWCKFFRENQFLIGVSVDGTAALHDRYRRMKNHTASYEKVLRGISLLDQYQVDYNILTVVTEDLAANIESVYFDYLSRGWMYQQYIACLSPMGGGPETRYALKPETYGKFLIRLFRLWKRDLERRKAPYIRQFDNYIGILLGYQPEACEQQGKCGIHYAIEADGSVYPCDFYMTDSYFLGNINEVRLEQIDHKRKELRFLSRSVPLPDQCLACPYFSLCRGGCRRNREASDFTGDSGVNRFCESYRMFFDETLEEWKQIAARISG